MVSREKFERRGGPSFPDPTGEAASSVELEALVRELRANARGIYGSLKRLVFVEWQRLRLRAVDGFFRAAFFLCLLGFALAGSITAAFMIVRGMRGAILAMSDVPWLGDLGAGLLILGISLGGCLAVRQHLRSSIVRETKRGLLPAKLRAKTNGHDAGVAEQNETAGQSGAGTDLS